MGKKKALGMDPLTWLKSKNKEEKYNGVSNQRKPAKRVRSGSVVNLSSSKQKVREARTYESSDMKGKFRDIVFGGKKSARKSRFSTASKENPATIFVVVYTVLLLVLGFLVYKDMTRKINKLETKLTSIERQIGSDPMAYGDINFD